MVGQWSGNVGFGSAGSKTTGWHWDLSLAWTRLLQCNGQQNGPEAPALVLGSVWPLTYLVLPRVCPHTDSSFVLHCPENSIDHVPVCFPHLSSAVWRGTGLFMSNASTAEADPCSLYSSLNTRKKK